MSHATKKDLLGSAGATVTGAGSWVRCPGPKSFQVTGVMSTGSGSLVCKIQGTNDTSRAAVDLATVTLSLTTTEAADGFTVPNAPYVYVRANVTTLTANGTAYASVGHQEV